MEIKIEINVKEPFHFPLPEMARLECYLQPLEVLLSEAPRATIY